MYEIALCGDDITFTATFEKMLYSALAARNLPCHLVSFTDIPSLQNAMEHGYKYNLIFLDILFQKENGIEFARFLREQEDNTDIVFVSTNPEYAITGYDVAPLHYLLKPVKPDKLEAALDRFLSKNTTPGISFTTSRGVFRLLLSEILYFEIYGHNITIHQTNGKKETCTGTLKELEKHLPPMTFVRPHRSYIINLDHVSEITRFRIQLSSGEIIPISKNLFHKIQHQFIDYAAQKSISL